MKKCPLGIADILAARRDEVLRLAAEHGARDVRVFGSVARGDASPESDVDFLVEMEDGRSLLDVASLLVDLEVLLGRNVDVLTPNGIHWYIRDRVLREAVPL